MKRVKILLCALALLAVAPMSAPSLMVPGADVVVDLHGDPVHADLVLFVGGNQWFVLPELLAAFRRAHPEVRDVFYETLPPGVLSRQLESGALHVGELVVRVAPDVFIAGQRRMAAVRAEGLVGTATPFATNVLGIMVRSGNPKHITGWKDLGRSDVRVAMPNPKTEGIARQIELAMRKAGGAALVQKIVVQKVADGTTTLTRVHHRETPMWILAGKADAGPVWISEALYQERIHSGLMAVPVPPSQNATGVYEAAVVAGSRHAAAARAFVAFLGTPQAQAIYRSYGFAAPSVTKE